VKRLLILFRPLYSTSIDMSHSQGIGRVIVNSSMASTQVPKLRLDRALFFWLCYAYCLPCAFAARFELFDFAQGRRRVTGFPMAVACCLLPITSLTPRALARLPVSLDEATQHFIEFLGMLSVREMARAIKNIHARIMRVPCNQIE
jgi:hypothetical protein